MDDIEDGSHTFEVTFEDKIGQIVSKSMIFYIDTASPAISLISPSETVYLDDDEFADIKNTPITDSGLKEKFDTLSLLAFSDAGAKLIGNFTNAYATMFEQGGDNKFWYIIDNDPTGWKEGIVTVTTPTAKTVPWQIDLADIDDGIHRLSIRVKDVHGNGYDKDSTDPILSVSGGGRGYQTDVAFMLERGIPVLTMPTLPEFVTGDLIIAGTVTGTSSLRSLNLKLNTNDLNLNWTLDPSDTDDTEIVIDDTNAADKEYTYTITIPAATFASIGEKSYSMKLTATGGAGSDVQTGNFIFDKTAPTIQFNTPNGGTLKYPNLPSGETGNLDNNDKYSIRWSDLWVTGRQPISGTTKDTNGIKKIHYHLGKLNNTVLFNDGYAEADRKAAYDINNFYFDNISTPSGIWRDTKLDEDSPVNMDSRWSGNLSSWTFTDDLNQYWDKHDPDNTDPDKYNLYDLIEKDVQTTITSEGKNKFYLPLYLRVEDRAGNISIVHYKIFVDPDLDIPRIELTSPAKRVVLTETEITTINTLLNANNLGSNPTLQGKYNDLVSTIITDTNAKLSGTFTDEYSAIFGEEDVDKYIEEDNKTYWYKIDDGAWKQGTIDSSYFGRNTVNWQIDLESDASKPDYLADGIHRLSIRVKDVYGNGYGKETLDDDAIADLGIDSHGYETDLAFMVARATPVLEITNTGTFINSASTIEGTVENALFIKSLSIRVDGALSTGTITETRQSDGSYKFSMPLSAGLTEASHSVQVNVTGASGQSAMEIWNFTYDKTAPTLNFNAPGAGTQKASGNLTNGKYSIWWSNTWITGATKIGGVSDDKNGLAKIYYHIGKLNNNTADGSDDTAREIAYNTAEWTDTLLDQDIPASNWSGGLNYWNYSADWNPNQFILSIIEEDVDGTTNDISAFFLPFYVKVVDRAGNINIVQYKLYIDPDMDIPQASIQTPSDGVRVGGEVRISGTANDNNWVHSVDIRIQDMVTGAYYKNPEDAWVDEANGWVKTKIMGNTDVVVGWYYSVNADAKLNPDPGMQERHVQVQVRAWDTKDMINHQVPDLNGSPSAAFNYYFDSGVPTISVPLIEKAGNPDRDYADGIRVSGNFKISADVQDDGGLSSIRARITGGSAFTEIVNNGEVVTTSLQTGWTVTPPASVGAGSWQKGWRYHIVNPGSITNWDEIDLAYSTGKNYVQGVMIQYTGVPANGTGSAMQANVGTIADNILGLSPTDPNYEDSDDNPNSDNWNSQMFKYTVAFTIDSTDISNLVYGKTGIFTLELDVYDNNQIPGPYSTRGTYNLSVDNYYPTTVITTQYNAATKNFYVMGTAQDYDTQSGTILGLERVLVYFERGGVYYNPRNKTTDDTDAFYQSGAGAAYSGEWATIPAMGDWPNVRNMSPTAAPGYGPNGDFSGNFPLLKLRAKGGNTGDVWESPHAMVIDSQELGELVDTADSDGTFAEMWDGRVDKIWQARLDTSNFTDGPITVHYIVMDMAGNATHYTDDIYIGNNRPLIRSFSLGTDIKNTGAAWSYATNPGDYAGFTTVGTTADGNKEHTTDFRVRNNRFGLRLEALYGNSGKHYRVFYVNREATSVPSTTMDRGEVYTIDDPGNTDWTKYGAFNNNAGTTFVASGPARATNDQGNTTNGTAWKYASVGTDPVNVELTEKRGDFGLLTNGTINEFDIHGNPIITNIDLVNDIVFENFNNMPDTAGKTYDANGNMNLLNDKRFIIKVYDTTVPAGAEGDQLAHVALFNVDFDNEDGIAPKISINPFHWNSATDNSLYENSRTNGHIELEADLPAVFTAGGTGLMDRDPKVSGKISIRGTSFDNNTIGAIYFRITNYNDTGAGAATTNIGGQNYYQAATYSGGNWTLTDRFATANAGWKFSINTATQKHDQDGHFVEWQLDFDTRFVTGVASLDNVITVVARDIKPPTANTSDIPGTFVQTTQAAKTPQYRFDVVPYISGISTTDRTGGGLKDNNIRSADGKYSVIQGTNANFITVKGFNLNPANNNVRIQNQAQRDAHATNPAIAINGAARNPANVAADRSSFQITNNSNSGYLAVWVNGIPSLNNINDNNVTGSFTPVTSGTNASNGYNEENMPNRDADRYTTKNITLTDDRYLQFQIVRQTDVKNGYYPVMIMNGNNPVFGYIDPKGGPNANPAAGAGGGAGTLHYDDARPQRAEFNYTNANALYKEYLIKNLVADQMAMAKDDAGRYGHYTVFNYSTGDSTYIYDRYAELWGNQGLGWAAGTTYTDWPASVAAGRYRSSDTNNTAMSFEAPLTALPAAPNGGTTQLDRFLYPKLIIRGNSVTGSATNYLAYFDDATTNKQIIFRTFQVGTNAGVRNTRLSYTGAQNDSAGRRYDTFTNIGAGAVIGNTGRNPAANNASKYFDMGVLSTGRVVLVYLDESDGRLKLRYSNNNIDGATTAGLAFSDNNNITLPDYVGMYVSMHIDSADRIHIAAYDFLNSELRYIFIPSYNANTYSSAKVDQFGSVGYWTDIKLNGAGVPYIAYYNMAEAGQRDSIKLAYAKNAVAAVGDVRGGVDENGYTTGNWEYTTIPALNPPQGGDPRFQKVNLGFMTDGKPMLGYLGTNIEFSYPVGE
ncbi:MAG: hypothetical protein LBI04_08425 [Treponema sp.]|nr:hypothetical protein [Treponema sp.]